MERREIDRIEYGIILRELQFARRFQGDIDITTGVHEDHGVTILIRHGSSFIAVVDEPSYLDIAKTERSRSPEDRAVNRALRKSI